MKRTFTALTVAACLAWPCSTVFAQRNTGNKTGQTTGKQGRTPRAGGDRDEGTEYGAVVSIRSFGAQNSEKIGQIIVRSNAGKQVNVHLTDRTRYLLAGADMDREMVNALLVKDVPVTLQWRYSAETGGKVAYSIEVRTIAIQGTVTKANKRQLTVSALPVAREEETEPAAPPIRAGGRKIADPPKRPAPKAPVPKSLTLIVKEHLTRLSLNGEKTEAGEIKPKMTFDALVVDGGPRWLIELNARSADGRTPGDKDDDAGKPEDDGKPVKGKPKAKPKPPTE